MKQHSFLLWYIPVYFVVLIIALLTACIYNSIFQTTSNRLDITGRSIVIIDPGHGGVDGGATSCTGVLESGINLQIATRLNDLMHLLGYKTVMTRREDVSIHTEGSTIAQKKVSDLKQRVKIVNTTENGLLISIHQNLFQDARYSGAQVFYSDSDNSNVLAKQLQSAFVQHLNPGSRRLAKRGSGIYLLEHIKNTGVLIECGFLSNPNEEAMLRNSQYQIDLCCVIAVNLSNYLDRLNVC